MPAGYTIFWDYAKAIVETERSWTAYLPKEGGQPVVFESDNYTAATMPIRMEG